MRPVLEGFTFKALYWKSCKKRRRRPEGRSPPDLGREAKRGEKQLYKLLII
jgi:hypothetical protein